MPSMSGANSEQNATAISPPSANSTRAEEVCCILYRVLGNILKRDWPMSVSAT